MEYVLGAVLIWTLLVLVLVNGAARERERAFVKHQGQMFERSMKSVTVMLERVLNPVIPDHPPERDVSTNDGSGAQVKEEDHRSYAQKLDDMMNQGDEDVEYSDPIDLGQPLDAFAQMDEDSEMPLDIGVMTSAHDARERAIVVEPGYDPVADMMARAEAEEQ